MFAPTSRSALRMSSRVGDFCGMAPHQGASAACVFWPVGRCESLSCVGALVREGGLLVKTSMFSLFIIASFVLPSALATLQDSRNYVGTSAGVGGFCTTEFLGADTGVACNMACNVACTVTVADDVLGAGAYYFVCDWNGVSDVNCNGDTTAPVTGPTAWTSTTGIVDIFIVAGTSGVVTTT